MIVRPPLEPLDRYTTTTRRLPHAHDTTHRLQGSVSRDADSLP
jgi:hypothetical protein